MDETNKNQVQKTKQRIPWIDTVKGIAIILVVVGHNAEQTVTSFIFCFHMPLFFLLSGYIFSPNPVNIYLKRSYKRLLIPYIVFLAIIAFISFINNGNLINEMGGYKYFLFIILYGGQLLPASFGVFWFVSVLWVSTNLFNYILNCNIKLWGLPLFIITGYLAEFISYPLPWNLHVVPMATAYIWTGFLLRHRIIPWIQSRIHLKITAYLPMAIIVIIYVFILRYDLTIDMKYNNYGLYGISFLSSVTMSICVALVAIILSHNYLLCKILAGVGVASMVIMYLHQPIKYILLSRLDLQDNYLIAIILEVLLSLCTYWLFKQTKITRKACIGM